MIVGISSKTSFVVSFFPPSRLATLWEDICCFRQKEKESVSRSWIRFAWSLKFALPLSIPESELLRNFYDGLDKCSAHHLDVGKPFLQRDPAEYKYILDMLPNHDTYFMLKPCKEESESSHESPSIV
jgi:hypothetical protein